MNEVVAIVEGETEQTFVRDQLAAHLGARQIVIWPVLPGRHRRRGGVRKWEAAKPDIIRTLKEGRYCTTMFDYYRLPDDWPGRSASREKPWSERADEVEHALLTAISTEMGGSFNPSQFIPYVQLHEFEALLFSDVDKLASLTATLTGRPADEHADYFNQILEEAGHPEAINDRYETCPSRRVAHQASAYHKRSHGPILTQRIGLATLRDRCHHFAAWLHRLETLADG